MKKLLPVAAVAAACVFAFSALAANPIKLTEPCDLATVTAPVYQQHVDCEVDTLTPFTLSEDVSWMESTYALRVTGGRTRFDFASGGDHQFQSKQIYIESESTPYVEFKGGILDGESSGTGGHFKLANTYPSNDRTIVFDGTAIRNFHDLDGLEGRNATLVFTNGASLLAGTVNVFFKLTDKTYTGNFIHVSTGSKYRSYGNINWEASGPGSSDLMNNRMLVEGAGTEFGPASGYHLLFGRYSSGNELVARDGAQLSWCNATVGSSEYSKSNTIFATGTGTKLGGTGALTIGTAVGADYNRVIVADGADLTTQIYNGTSVGAYGSYNELVISNATLSRTYWMTAGVYPGANHNKVRIFGTSSLSLTSQAVYIGGQGRYNEWIFDDADFQPTSTLYIKMSKASGTDENFSGSASTNNMLSVVNDSTVACYDLIAHVSSMSNTITVGSGSTLSVSHDMYIRGDGNTVFVSNGTLRCSQSGPGLCLGNYVDAKNPASPSALFSEGRNRLVLQGAHPVIARIDDRYNSSAKIYSDGIVRFEVPPTGYPLYDDGNGGVTNAPIFQAVTLDFYNSGTLEIAGVLELARNLTAPVDYMLTSQAMNLNSPDEGESVAKMVAAANATLPRGSYAYIGDSGTLWLHVAPYRGTTLVIR